MCCHTHIISSILCAAGVWEDSICVLFRLCWWSSPEAINAKCLVPPDSSRLFCYSGCWRLLSHLDPIEIGELEYSLPPCLQIATSGLYFSFTSVVGWKVTISVYSVELLILLSLHMCHFTLFAILSLFILCLFPMFSLVVIESGVKPLGQCSPIIFLCLFYQQYTFGLLRATRNIFCVPPSHSLPDIHVVLQYEVLTIDKLEQMIYFTWM